MGSEYEVRILSRDEYPLWDELVIKSPQGTIFHLSKWIIKCAELISKNEIIYGFFKNGALVAGCSIYSGKILSFLSLATSTAPMTPYGGYVFAPFESSKVRENELQYKKVISAINSEIERRYEYINIVNSPEIRDIRPFSWNGWKTNIYYTYSFKLDNKVEDNVSRNVRRTVNKAKKLGITVKKECDPYLYYHLNCKTYEKQHLKSPVSKKFLINMIDFIISTNIGEMWIARTPDGDPVAAEIIIWDNKCAHRWSAASDPQFNDTGAISFLLIEIFKDLQKRGFNKINLMAGNTLHLTKFISSFNPDLVPYYGLKISYRIGKICNLFFE